MSVLSIRPLTLSVLALTGAIALGSVAFAAPDPGQGRMRGGHMIERLEGSLNRKLTDAEKAKVQEIGRASFGAMRASMAKFNTDITGFTGLSESDVRDALRPQRRADMRRGDRQRPPETQRTPEARRAERPSIQAKLEQKLGRPLSDAQKGRLVAAETALRSDMQANRARFTQELATALNVDPAVLQQHRPRRGHQGPRGT